ncbi:bifunctional lysylphosphatidylglycerol synthetase/lysine--tRNA ligase LysX [Micrococcus luteus]|uniref:bifunctional lysylphosphatidylglycerol synthetase/lysine--tRNA ligase LysX n=1 Tax=Micrococcus luteus TaxID=1270 RepID=UPI0011A96898|nr:bifunctional lysylphosphatidylglycerol synthetase/lysine--tRNA ligase LysX [Micrococcus luteus]
MSTTTGAVAALRAPNPAGLDSPHPRRTDGSGSTARGDRRIRRGSGPLSAVPAWTGRILHLTAFTLVAVALFDAALPEGVYWAASYFAVFGLTPQPFLFNAVLLFIVGSAAKRRLRGALVFILLFEAPTIALPLVSAAFAVFTGRAPEVDPESIAAALVASLAATVLLVARHEFSARLQPASYLSAATVFIGGVTVAVVLGGGLSENLVGTSTSRNDDWWWSLHAAVGFYPGDLLLDDSSNRLHPTVELVVTSVAAASLLAAVVILLHTARTQRLLSTSDELQIRRILRAEPTEDSLAYFATRRDKSVVFTTDRKAAVSFRVIGTVALASGDPLGPEQSWDEAIRTWLAAVSRYGWRPAVLAATEKGAEAYARFGMRGSVLGDEAVLHVVRSGEGRSHHSPDVDAARRRVRRAGYTVRLRRQFELSAPERLEIEQVADLWRRNGDERGFSMALSRTADPADRSSIVATAHDSTGQVMVVLVFVPWSTDGLSLDLMRRHPDAVNGATTFVIASLMSEARTFGVRRVSLNFTVLRDVLVQGNRVSAGRLLRWKRSLLMLLSQRWQWDSLRRANEKHDPEWRARFVMWGDETTRGAAMVAMARAEGFLPGCFGSRRTEAAARPGSFPELVQELESETAQRLPPSASRRARNPRFERSAAWREKGVDPYPPSVPRTHSVRQVLSRLSAASPGVADKPDGDGRCSVAGRLTAHRRHGGIAFLDLVEEGEWIQLIATADETTDFALLAHLDLGDIVSATGIPVLSRTGERSLAVRSWSLAAKSLQQPPNRHSGLRDPEAQLRSRHIHLATDLGAARLVHARSRALRALRETLFDGGYVEVETPILQRTNGGANARPFRTHIHAYDRELTLRIAPELALKRLVVAGFPQVFEIGRNFRNEGVDASHNPEFTAMEAYRAYADYNDMRQLAEKSIMQMAIAVNGAPVMVGQDGVQVDIAEPWHVVSVCDALSEQVGARVSTDLGPEVLTELARVYGISVAAGDSSGVIIERMYEELVEAQTTSPTFYTDFPAETSPLARPHRSAPGLAERWDLVVFGMELGTAYTELNDPLEQRRRLSAQSLKAALGDPEAMSLDEDFLHALEYGMPPTGGLGVVGHEVLDMGAGLR